MLIIDSETIRAICKKSDIQVELVESFQHNDRVDDFRINNHYLIRFSKRNLDEIEKLIRVQSISFVPKIYDKGTFTQMGISYNYLLMDYSTGSDLFCITHNLTEEEANGIGKDLLKFLREMNSIKDNHYDVGHYIPTIPRTKQRWKDAHEEYVKYLHKKIAKISMDIHSTAIIADAFKYISSNDSCLEYEGGAVLLHNDLHPKNIIVSNGRVTGVIDWECSQYGEADFELAHLFHWCIYPPKMSANIEAVLKTVFKSFQEHYQIPEISKRLTIYQLEHELNQIVWSELIQQERLQRIECWLDKKIEKLISRW